MVKAVRTKQLNFVLPAKVGLLNKVSSTIAKAGVNITALCAYEESSNGHFLVVTSNNEKAKKALTKLASEVKEENVVAVEMPNKVGELEKVTKKIAKAGVNIHYVYGSVPSVKNCFCVFDTSNNEKTIKVVNK